jgi:putative toxin-antitoxin system antitoxin component (TIGR02293 family)
MGVEAFHPDYQYPANQSGDGLFDVIARVVEGYPFASFVTLAERLGVAQSYLAKVLSISSSTLQRRRSSSFNAAESGRIYQLEQLVALAEKTVGDRKDALRWLSNPNPNLGAVPLDLARTAPGLEAVKRYLEQIADGVYL